MRNKKVILVWLVIVTLTLGMADNGLCFFGKKELRYSLRTGRGKLRNSGDRAKGL